MLHGICHGFIGPPRGLAGRSLLGRQTVPYRSTAGVGADTLAARLTPAAAVGDILIASIALTPNSATLRIRDNGTYYANVNGSSAPQSANVDGYSKVLSALYGEGALIINDRPPIPAIGNTFFGNVVLGKGTPVNTQLQAVDPDTASSAGIIFSVVSGALPPGLSMNSTGLVTGTPTTLGSFGFVIRIQDSFGAYTDVPDSAVVASVLPNFVGQQLSVATVTVTALGLTVSSSSTASALPQNQIISQTPTANTPVTNGSTVVNFIVSDGSGFIGLTNLFPNNIQGLTWNGTRDIDFNTSFHDSITGKPTTGSYTKYPTITWDLNYELLNQEAPIDDLKKIVGLFNQQQGQNLPFLYVDPAFNTVSGQIFAIGNGSKKTFQLVATYGVPGGPGLPEIVQALQNPSAVILFDLTAGTIVPSNTYTIGATGIVTFNTAPAANHVITWSGAFYYICKFVVDGMTPEQFMNNFWSLKTLRFRTVII